MPQFVANARSKFVTLAPMFVGLMICARLLAATPSPSTLSEHVTCARSTRSVTRDVVRPVTFDRAPLVLLVHGRSGMSFYAERLNGLARRLAESGFVVLIPHYFDATGDPDKPISGAVSKESIRSGSASPAFRSAPAFRWRGPPRMPWCGRSSRAPEGSRERFPEKVARMSPVLIIHADRDPIASVESMRRLEKRLRENGLSVEVLIDPSQTTSSKATPGTTRPERWSSS